MRHAIRRLATQTNSQFNVFDRNAKLLQRNRFPLKHPQESRKAEYLRDEIARKTIERLSFITRDLDKFLDFGSNSGNLLKQLCVSDTEDSIMIRNKIKDYVMLDSSNILYRDQHELYWQKFAGNIDRIQTDEETFQHPKLVANGFDAVVANASLHWINDLPKALANINNVLKPDGLFLGTLFGNDTIFELRTSLQLAELERKGGLSPRVSPFVQLNDVGSLLNRAGFNLLTIDVDDIVVGGYPDIVAVMNDLQLMGEQNVVLSRSNYLDRDVLLAANEIYKTLHGEEHQGQVTLPATFNVIFMIGWKKSEDQPKPLARGSGQVNLKHVL